MRNSICSFCTKDNKNRIKENKKKNSPTTHLNNLNRKFGEKFKSSEVTSVFLNKNLISIHLQTQSNTSPAYNLFQWVNKEKQNSLLPFYSSFTRNSRTPSAISNSHEKSFLTDFL